MSDRLLIAPSFSVVSLGLRLAALRRALHMSQKDLADQIGRSVNSVSRWENGTQEMGIGDAVAIAKLFGVTVTALVHDDAMQGAVAELAIRVLELGDRLQMLSAELRDLRERRGSPA